MKYFLILLTVIAFSVSAKCQAKNDVKRHHPKIKNANVIIVPDQKPVIIERMEDSAITKGKQGSINRKNNLSKAHQAKPNGAKPAQFLVKKQHKKAVPVTKNKAEKER